MLYKLVEDLELDDPHEPSPGLYQKYPTGRLDQLTKISRKCPQNSRDHDTRHRIKNYYGHCKSHGLVQISRRTQPEI
ncbi:hypothetical protein HPB48_002635 [Haemaphysalis longicornis]|uniref:Uncharacterized protein n=1 Tax=Haemaphysalis longicornis TaxID=44386 RepID=A0A9J6G1U7_HAELO|nr:hypothetical protein HPB48_002635 [Haemaphysalis longicornis]